MGDRLVCRDFEAALEDQTAAQPVRGAHGEACDRARGGARDRALSEDVEKGGEDQQREQRQDRAAKPDLVRPALKLEVAAPGEVSMKRRHSPAIRRRLDAATDAAMRTEVSYEIACGWRS